MAAMRAHARDIAIEKLKVSACRDAAKAYVHDLESSEWNCKHNEWLLVRSLKVHGPQSRLRQQTHQALDSARQGAVFGGSANAQQANAVHFQDLSELLAFLLRDIANGDAAFRWYWQNWSNITCRDKCDAITQLMWGHVQHLSQVTYTLWRVGALKKVWMLLSAQGALCVLEELQHHLPQIKPSLGSDDIRAHHPDEFAQIFLQVLRGSPEIVRIWKSVIEDLDPSDARCTLLCYVVGSANFPVLFAKAPQVASAIIYNFIAEQHSLHTEEERFSSKLHTNKSVHDASPNSTQTANGLRADNASLIPDFIPSKDSNRDIHHQDKISKEEDASKIALVKQTLSTTSLNVRMGASETTELKNQVKSAARKDDEKYSGSDNSHAQIDENNESEKSNVTQLAGEFFTANGGAFYLLNALRNIESTLLDALTQNQEGQGFKLWYDLIRCFETDIDIPFERFLASQMHYSSIESMRAQGKHPYAESAYESLAQAYPKVWKAELLRSPALVTYTRNHIDVYLPMTSIKIAVRLYGLDVNPTWLPWLGRVVTLHYREGIPQPSAESLQANGEV